jgi:hypothetical protein
MIAVTAQNNNYKHNLKYISSYDQIGRKHFGRRINCEDILSYEYDHKAEGNFTIACETIKTSKTFRPLKSEWSWIYLKGEHRCKDILSHEYDYIWFHNDIGDNQSFADINFYPLKEKFNWFFFSGRRIQ